MTASCALAPAGGRGVAALRASGSGLVECGVEAVELAARGWGLRLTWIGGGMEGEWDEWKARSHPDACVIDSGGRFLGCGGRKAGSGS